MAGRRADAARVLLSRQQRASGGAARGGSVPCYSRTAVQSPVPVRVAPLRPFFARWCARGETEHAVFGFETSEVTRFEPQGTQLALREYFSDARDAFAVSEGGAFLFLFLLLARGRSVECVRYRTSVCM